MEYRVKITMGCHPKSDSLSLSACSGIGDLLEIETVAFLIGEPEISNRTVSMAGDHYAEVILVGKAASRKDALKVGKVCEGIIDAYPVPKFQINFSPIPEMLPSKQDECDDEAEPEESVEEAE